MKLITSSYIVLFATAYSIVPTMMTFLTPTFDKMWLAIEIISLPVIYTLGYGHVIAKQKQGFEKTTTKIIGVTSTLLSKLEKAEKRNSNIKKV